MDCRIIIIMHQVSQKRQPFQDVIQSQWSTKISINQLKIVLLRPK